MGLQFLSLSSGSSGNCYYLGTETYGILIDAGIGPRTIKKYLKDNGIPFERIIALLITHDHTDHIKYAGVLGEKYGIPVYSTRRIHDGMSRNYSMTEKIYSARREISKEVTFDIRDFKITAFEVSHDGSDNVGYKIEFNDVK
ncbi:MAG: MBL fold metallo-hydrolase, partial [Bacteroidales bacterium]